MCVTIGGIFSEQDRAAAGNVQAIATAYRRNYAARADAGVAEGIVWITPKSSVGRHLQPNRNDLSLDQSMSQFCRNLCLGFAWLTASRRRLNRVHDFASQETQRLMLSIGERQSQPIQDGRKR